ncbi:MAG TPA: peptidylprolyl isomerase [Kofleriaceae bacterium]|nr:peptidylprolyl isomerase [Kofleriaceae bacterium]
MRTLALLLIALTAAPAFAQPAPPRDHRTSPNAGKKVQLERVVAVVNDSIILSSELDARLVPVMAEAQQIQDPAERRRRIAKLASQVLDEMVNEELIVQAADAAHVEVDSSEVQAALDEIKQQNGLDDAGLAQALSAQGYTMQNYRMDLRRQLLRLRAQNQLVAPKVQITEEDVRARYDQMQRRSDAVSAIYLSHILIKLPDHPTEQQIADAKAKAAKAIERVKGGEPFLDVAKQVSDDQNVELGWFQRGSLTPETEQVVFSMEKGDVRGPYSEAGGVRVFFVSDVKNSSLKPYAEMKDQLKNELRRRELDKQTAAWVEELRKKAYIDIKLQ